MKNKFFLVACLFAVGGVSGFAFGAEPSQPVLSHFFKQELSSEGGAVCELRSSEEEGEEPSSDWELRRVFLNIKPYATFGIDGVVDLTVAPEIELVWEKSPELITQ